MAVVGTRKCTPYGTGAASQLGYELARQGGLVVSGLAKGIDGIILAACVGSSMAAQIGTMSVNDEIAALEIMSISPVRFLMAPRMAAHRPGLRSWR